MDVTEKDVTFGYGAGIEFRIDASDYSTVNQIMTIVHNVIEDNGSNGIEIDIDASPGAGDVVIVSQKVTLSHNTITGNCLDRARWGL